MLYSSLLLPPPFLLCFSTEYQANPRGKRNYRYQKGAEQSSTHSTGFKCTSGTNTFSHTRHKHKNKTKLNVRTSST